MENKLSLLNKIKSKYILKLILSLAYENFSSVFKLVKYNKSLMNKLDINLKNMKYLYKSFTEIKKGKAGETFFIFCFSLNLFKFIFLMVYIILIDHRGTFKDHILKIGYNKSKKKYVDFRNYFALPAFFIYTFLYNLINYFLMLSKKIYIQKKIKLIFVIFIFVIEVINYLMEIIKVPLEKSLIKENIIKSEKSKDKDDTWFYSFDYCIIYFFYSAYIFEFSILIILYFCLPKIDDDSYDSKTIWLYQFKGINIINFKFPVNFQILNEKEKREMIFKTYINEYYYNLDDNSIDLIKKINDIRKRYNINLLNFYKVEYLPDFIKNEKTEIIFFENKNIYKINCNSYIFKYPKNKFQNFLYNKEILNIITMDILDEINIIEIKNFEFISIYKKEKNNINNLNLPNNENKNEIHSARTKKNNYFLINNNTNIPELSNSEENASDQSSIIPLTESSNHRNNVIHLLKPKFNYFEVNKNK